MSGICFTVYLNLFHTQSGRPTFCLAKLKKVTTAFTTVLFETGNGNGIGLQNVG